MKSIELVRSLHDLWNGGDLALITEIYAPDFVGHWPGGSEIPLQRGHAGISEAIIRIRSAFPDWHEEIVDIFASRDRVTSRYISTGTHLGGTLWGAAPTGRRVKIQEISIYRVDQNRVAEQWCAFDDLGRLRQLGFGGAQLEEIFQAQPQSRGLDPG